MTFGWNLLGSLKMIFESQFRYETVLLILFLSCKLELLISVQDIFRQDLENFRSMKINIKFLRLTFTIAFICSQKIKKKE